MWTRLLLACGGRRAEGRQRLARRTVPARGGAGAQRGAGRGVQLSPRAGVRAPRLCCLSEGKVVLKAGGRSGPAPWRRREVDRVPGTGVGGGDGEERPPLGPRWDDGACGGGRWLCGPVNPLVGPRGTAQN